jgi:hypothetical protein
MVAFDPQAIAAHPLYCFARDSLALSRAGVCTVG